MELEYEIKKSRRAKNIRLAIYPDASVVLTIPWWAPKYLGRRFFEAKKSWVLDRISKLPQTGVSGAERHVTRKDYLENREKARVFISERLKHFNQFYNFNYQRVSIRDTRTRWGSCTRAGNLNFCYKLLFLPPELADYIVVHELCHLGELNHSAAFWRLVAQTVPNYKEIRKRLKGNLSLL